MSDRVVVMREGILANWNRLNAHAVDGYANFDNAKLVTRSQ